MRQKLTPSLGSYLLKKWREERTLTQNEAAERIGVDFVQVSKFERGALKPGRENAVKIEQAAGIAVASWDEPVPARHNADERKAG